ncbi:hypothetical protein CHH61_03975 [Shouchella clausii]|uniref:Uncharacterized protein n=1 Tax=Shouchella clausii TaxID=79880 RepID=A0A268S457_SHOCL|nr:hypothetical protein [Shouchella clausii]PAF27294.1 hypothetical protein CHH61_03975 [Shouchella clausii]
MTNGKQKQTREQLGVQEGDKIILKGKVTYARLDKAISGEALTRENERRARMGMLHTKPFRSVTIENPEIVQGEGTPLALFHAQEVYQSKTTGNQTMSFESKSLFPPSYGHMQENGTVKEIPDPEKNPAQGQIIYLMITAFKAKGFNNLGSTFDTIVFEKGDIQFYEGKGNSLAGFGQAMNMPVENITNTGAEPRQLQGAPTQEELVGVGAGQNQNGFGQAPINDPNQNGNQGGFGGFGGFGQQGGFGQTEQNGTNSNPFGIQGGAISDQGSPFTNNGQRGKSPYA